jgi:Domain of unknown function (DUF4384)
MKHKIPFLSVCFFLFVFFLSHVGSFAAYQPEWLQTHLDGALELKGVYHGVSFALFDSKTPDYDTQRLAKDRALDDLCYQLSVSVQSKFEDSFVKKGVFEEQQIAASLFISTRHVLSGVREKDTWTDAGKNRHWVLLVIDKEKADRQIEEQKFINEVVDRLEHRQDEILRGIQQMTSILNNTLQLYKDRMNQFEHLLQSIDTKVEASGIQVKDAYASLQQDIIQLEKSRKAFAESLSQSEKKQAEQMDELMAQNNELKMMMGQLTQRIQQDYFLALADDDIKYKDADSDFRVNIRPDKGQGADYGDGERVRFLVQASRGCYIKMIYISSQNGMSGNERKINTLLFPNKHDHDNWINAGESKIIGQMGELQIQPPFGKDVITLIASEKQFSGLDGLISGAQGGYYTEMTADTRSALKFRNRGIQVVQPENNTAKTSVDSQLQPVLVATDTCFIVSHPR